MVKNARKINFSQRKISSHPKTTVTEENDFVFLKGFGNGGENVQKSSAAKFRDLDGGKKSRKNEICEGKNLGNL